MRVASLFFPRFPVQRRVLEQPSLAGRPLGLWVDEQGSQRLRFASGAALRGGVTPGQTVAAASALEPALVRLRFVPEDEARALGSLGEALLPLAPGFQLDPPEGLWLDASAAPLCGDEARWAERLLGACRGLGLRGRCVVGGERFSTQALARWGHAPVQVLPPRGGPQLARLPLEALEAGWLGAGATAPFRALGLSTLGELAGLPVGALVARFGAAGRLAARLCRGEDESRFVAHALPEVLEEAVTLDWPAEQLEPVLFALKTVVDRLCARLQGRQRAAVRLRVTVSLERGAPLEVPLVLSRPSAQARLLVELVRHRLTDLTVAEPITALTVTVLEAGDEPGLQLALGDAPVGEAALELVLARLQSALGEDALFSAAPVAAHAPEAGWRPTRPLAPAAAPSPPPPRASPPPPGAWPKRRAKAAQAPEVLPWAQAARPPRLFPSPARLEAELSAEGALLAVTLAGRRRRVEDLTGPERLVGSWWSPEAFARDYYRVRLEGLGALWVYRDGADGAFYAQGAFD